MRRATRKIKLDANHKAVVAELRQRGIEVVEIMEPVDLVVAKNGFSGFLELKIEGSKANFTRTQLAFIAGTRIPIAIAKSVPDALRFLETGIGLSQTQKDALAGILAKNPAQKLWTANTIERLLNT
jgi:hypothetical protein